MLFLFIVHLFVCLFVRLSKVAHVVVERRIYSFLGFILRELMHLFLLSLLLSLFLFLSLLLLWLWLWLLLGVGAFVGINFTL